MADKQLLLVEGKDDEHVFYHLLIHHQIPQTFSIKSKDGIEKLLDTLDVELLASGLERLGIVVDADTDLTRRWQSLRNILQSSGYSNVPDVPIDTGTIIHQNDKPIVGIWIMPDNRLPGMLEDFTGFLVPQGDSLWRRAEGCLQQIPEEDRRFSPIHQPKAHIHTWLAWQEEPGTPLGLAITRRYLDADAPHAQRLMNWVRQLFQV